MLRVLSLNKEQEEGVGGWGQEYSICMHAALSKHH